MKAISLRALPLIACALLPATSLLAADPPLPVISDTSGGGPFAGGRFVEQDGLAVYGAICQGCNMAEGQGAKGAGMYPALANNPKLAASGYLVYNILHGRHGMPGFGHFLSDEQVVNVANYVRTSMGNNYKDAVTPADVAKLR